MYRTHESPLMRSPKLAAEIQKARANRSDSKKTHLSLMAHDRNAFNQMLHYLYYDSFTLTKDPTSVEYLDEIKELMSLAKHYVLPGLQKQVVKLFTSSKLMEVMTLSEFFDWAEDMYFEEIDHENGPFKVYFSKVAPALMKKVDEGTKKELSRMIKHGGGFANELFLAVFTVSALCLTISGLEANRFRHWICRQSTWPSRKKSLPPPVVLLSRPRPRGPSVALPTRQPWVCLGTNPWKTASISSVRLGLLPLQIANLMLIYPAVRK